MKEKMSHRKHRRSLLATAILMLNLFALVAQAGDKAPDGSSSTTERAPVQFVPQTRSERFSNYVASVTNLESVVRAAVAGGIAQAQNTPKEWGGGGEGYGKRIGNAYAEHGIRQTLQYGVSAALHEDNRYFASGQSGFFPRTKYAIASVFLARHDDGSRSFSFSRLSSAAGELLSRAPGSHAARRPVAMALLASASPWAETLGSMFSANSGLD